MTLHDYPTADPATLARLHTRLTEAAHVDGSLDIAYRTLDTPVVMATASGLLIGDEPVHVSERLRARSRCSVPG